MRNSILLNFIIISVVFLTGINNVYAASGVNKKLELKNNYSNLITFNEKILRYKLADEEAFDIEILPGIFNDGQEMLIKPLKSSDTNLLIWTKSCLYNFEIESRDKKNFASIFNFGKKEKLVIDGYEIDLPPSLPQKPTFENLEIDLPPTPGE